MAADEITPSAKRLLPWLVAVAFFMEMLDSTVLNTAMPSIARSLDVATLSMKAVLTSYTLALAVFIPVSGWVADRFGTRRVFASAIGIFTLGSLLCGFSGSIHQLVACRILQGCGGALMVPVGRLTLVRTFPKEELVRAMSFVAIPSLIGPLLGPLVGGVIVGLLHWRVIFFVNVPIGALGLYLVYRHLPDYRGATRRPLDWIGLALFGTGVALLSYVLEIFGEHSLSTPWIVALLAIAVALIGAYVRHALRVPFPLLRLGLLKTRTLRTAVTGSFVARLGVGGMPFLLPLLYQVGLGRSPIESGLLLMPQSVAAMILKAVIPKILGRLGYRGVLLSNTLILGAMMGVFATVGAGTPLWLIAVQAFVFGFASSTQFTSMNTLVYADVAPEDTSMASTIASTLQQMSMSFGVATAAIVTGLFVPDRASSTPAAMVHGIHLSLLVLGGVTVLSALIFAGLRADDGQAVSQHKLAQRADAQAVAHTEA
jgi:EmrB/QacA subfamily drug resistance transporter